jgi:N-acetylglucosaminyldiphosphoundecaprenol N-acetyl-beta-D-mannosaminyltransferase
MDLLPVLLHEAAARGKSVFFYGGEQHVLDALLARIAQDVPTLRVAGAVSPPYRPITISEDQAYIDQINNAQTDLLFVALGCPKQEKWMASHQPHIKACMLGVGQAFLTYAGLEKRLPAGLRKLPVEWMYRLMLEPKRLFKRYAITNTHFLYKVYKGH